MEESLCDKVSQLLKERREELGLTIEELAQKAKVPSSIIEAFEKKDWDNLPEPVYVKGFLKKMCRVLELDEKEILDMFLSCELSRRSAPEIKRVSITKEKSVKIPVVLVFLLLIVGGIAFFMYVGKPFVHRYKKVGGVVSANRSESSNATAVKVENGSIASPEGNVTGNSSIEEKASVGREADEGFKFTITIKAVKGKSWYYLVVDGSNKRQGFIKKGESIDIKCKRVCSIKFGKPSVIEIYKGKEKILLPFDRPYTVIFTSDSFKILPR